jgi:hypothetical protein
MGRPLTKQIKVNKKNAKDQHLPLKTTIGGREEQGLHNDVPNKVTTQRTAVAETDGQGFSPEALSRRR